MYNANTSGNTKKGIENILPLLDEYQRIFSIPLKKTHLMESSYMNTDGVNYYRIPFLSAQ